MFAIKPIAPRKFFDTKQFNARALQVMQDYQHRLRDELRRYPPQIHGLSQPFRSEKSRRYFFWALRHGKISVPYKRTGGVREGWKIDVSTTGGDIRVTAKNTNAHAHLVQGDQQTADMKRRNWKQAGEIASKVWKERTLPELRILFTKGGK
jgi:hypothetical protein